MLEAIIGIIAALAAGVAWLWMRLQSEKKRRQEADRQADAANRQRDTERDISQARAAVQDRAALERARQREQKASGERPETFGDKRL